MLNFTVGPVQSGEAVRKIGSQQIPYFRTMEFSNTMKENEDMIKTLAAAPKDARVIFLTGSGTAAMEAAIMNTVSLNDRALIINGGSFGQRFVSLCQIYHVPHEELRLDAGKKLTEEMLEKYDGKGFTSFIINVHETSTGVLYDMNIVSRFCKRNGLFLIADAISSFLADELDMEKLGVDVMITGSQKAIACPPGISIMVVDRKAIERIYENHPLSMYLDLRTALKDGLRGQTPFTPAVGILLQIHERLKEIVCKGGVKQETERIAKIAEDFRDKIREFPFEIMSESLSNAVTPLRPIRACAYYIFHILKEEYGIWICPNGGELKHTIFRVGHIGNLTQEDNDILIRAFRDMQARGII